MGVFYEGKEQRAGIADIIKMQEEGQTLVVDGHGTFQVEWHLAGDLKTLKCLFGCDTGTSTKLTCLYCMSF